MTINMQLWNTEQSMSCTFTCALVVKAAVTHFHTVGRTGAEFVHQALLTTAKFRTRPALTWNTMTDGEKQRDRRCGKIIRVFDSLLCNVHFVSKQFHRK